VASVTPSIVCQLSSDLSMRWKARCPVCKDAGRKRVWQEYGPTRTAVEKKLNTHLRQDHRFEQEAML